MIYERACELVCSVGNRDAVDTRLAFQRLSTSQLKALAVTLAAMVPATSRPSRSAVEATAMILGYDGQPHDEHLDVAAEYVAEVCHVDVSDVLGRTRVPRAVQARMVLCWVARHVEGMSYPTIGRNIGRDHTTVMSAVKRVEQDPKLRTKAAVVAEMMRSGRPEVA